MKRQLSLGLDLSTQGLAAVILDIDRLEMVYEHSLDYIKDSRFKDFGLSSRDYILPPGEDGEANQPPEMYWAALDALLGDIQKAGVDMADIVVINNSAQQHGHVYLNSRATAIFNRLNSREASLSSLPDLLRGSLAFPAAPIWMTSNTRQEAADILHNIGGRTVMIQLSGSSAPLRFTGIIMRKIARQFPEAYRETARLQLLSSMITAILTGNAGADIDFGNACGMSLMNYHRRQWSHRLIKAVSQDLPGGAAGFRSKLPSLVAPDKLVGKVAWYFVSRYGFNPECAVTAGSGDNPQSKVLITGDLLSLGSSLVNMVSTDSRTLDRNGFANGMYDGVGRPFIFGCRTNGALVWDQVRSRYGLPKEDYRLAEKALQAAPLGQNLVFWQPRHESLPPSSSFDLTRTSHELTTFGTDYAGLIESAMAAVYYHSQGFADETGAPLYVTGGAAASPNILRRIAAIWKRPVIPIEEGGAALGAAAAGAYSWLKACGEAVVIQDITQPLLKTETAVDPHIEDVQAFHAPGGYLERFAVAEQYLIKNHPLV